MSLVERLTTECFVFSGCISLPINWQSIGDAHGIDNVRGSEDQRRIVLT